VSEIGIGAWQLGGPLLLDGVHDGHPDIGRETAVQLIRQCGDLGINFVDTAEQYGNGESERRVGEAIAGQRDRWVVSTKFGNQVGPRGERVEDVSAQRVRKSLEGSLRRLQTDHIDVYLYHIDPDPAEAPAVAEFLAAAREQGKIRAAGISTHWVEPCRRLLELGCLDVVQFPQNIMQPAKEMADLIRTHALGGVVRGAFFAGKLSGRYFDSPPDFSPDDVRSVRFKAAERSAFPRYGAFRKLVTPHRNMVQLALRYLLDKPSTATIILGAKDLPAYQQALAATRLPSLTPDELTELETIRRHLESVL